MNLKNLIGKIFQEKEFYELLLFDIEENFDQYYSKFIHFYFDRIEKTKIKITQVTYFNDSKEINNTGRTIIEKKEWFEISQNQNHFNLLLCRFDRTGYASSIWEDSSHTQDWRNGWADEYPDLEPMTRGQIWQAFMELSGVFMDQQKNEKLKSKKTA